MTTNIDPNDPRYFTETSSISYDRHHYRIVMKDGRSGVFDDYEKVRAFWFEYDSSMLSHVDVLDIKNTVKGFGGQYSVSQ